MSSLENPLQVKLFVDGADLESLLEQARNPHFKGFTTNPTLMRRAGISDYRAFAQELLQDIRRRPISFEVFADDFDEMRRQALEIASWGDNVYVKIPITNTEGQSSQPLIRELSQQGVKLNVTAILTLSQVWETCGSVTDGAASIISVFAGRIADTGRDPMPLMRAAVAMAETISPAVEILWASPRELLNIVQADQVGCHIITATPAILKKLALLGKDLAELSLDTVKMFHDDAEAAGYRL